MPVVLRKIQKSKWYKSGAVPWLPEEELQADALVDLSTKGNKLSIYIIGDDLSDLERVVTALASTREIITDFDYALFDQAILSEIDIKLEYNEGGTADVEVNKLHRDLIELTTSKIIALSNVIKERARKGRVLSKHVRNLVVKALASNQLDRTKLRFKPEVIEVLDHLVEAEDYR